MEIIRSKIREKIRVINRVALMLALSSLIAITTSQSKAQETPTLQNMPQTLWGLTITGTPYPGSRDGMVKMKVAKPAVTVEIIARSIWMNPALEDSVKLAEIKVNGTEEISQGFRFPSPRREDLSGYRICTETFDKGGSRIGVECADFTATEIPAGVVNEVTFIPLISVGQNPQLIAGN